MSVSTHSCPRHALAALLLVSTVAPAQTGRITGTVTGAGALPVVGAHVLLATAGLSAESGDNGKFTIRSVPAGTHDLKVYALGYRPLSVAGVAVNGFAQAHQEFLNMPLMGTMVFLGMRWEGR